MSKFPKEFGKRPHRRLVTRLGCECVRPLLTPPSNTWFLGLTWVSPSPPPNGISIGSAVFAGLTLLHKLAKSYALQWYSVVRTSSKIAPSRGGCRPHIIYGSLNLPKSPSHTASRSVKSFLHGSQLWPTDHATPFVAIGRILCIDWMWYGLITVNWRATDILRNHVMILLSSPTLTADVEVGFLPLFVFFFARCRKNRCN